MRPTGEDAALRLFYMILNIVRPINVLKLKIYKVYL